MREYRFLWIVWFIWASWLLHSLFPSAGIVKGSGSLLAVFIPALIFYQIMMRKRKMRIFNRKPKPAEADKTAAPFLPAFRAGADVRSGAQAKSAIATGADKTSIVACATLLTGNLESGGSVIVEGEVTGNITAQQVRIEKDGKVQGDITAQYIVINGQAVGKLHADTVTLQCEGLVEGTIFTEELIIDKGGIFIGQSQKKSALPAEKTRGKAKAELLTVADAGSKAAAAPASQSKAG